ncbi:hypothetical protein PR048_030641, partial [Dryococelus australis]
MKDERRQLAHAIPAHKLKYQLKFVTGTRHPRSIESPASLGNLSDKDKVKLAKNETAPRFVATCPRLRGDLTFQMLPSNEGTVYGLYSQMILQPPIIRTWGDNTLPGHSRKTGAHLNVRSINTSMVKRQAHTFYCEREWGGGGRCASATVHIDLPPLRSGFTLWNRGKYRHFVQVFSKYPVGNSDKWKEQHTKEAMVRKRKKENVMNVADGPWVFSEYFRFRRYCSSSPSIPTTFLFALSSLSKLDYTRI